MIANKRNIDGLPGVTMPGVKGNTGERGAMTFYNADASTAFDMTYLFSLGFVTTDSSYNISYVASNSAETEYNNSVVVPIYSNKVQPIIYDNILVTSSGNTVQYQIVGNIPITLNDIEMYEKLAVEESEAGTSTLTDNQVAAMNYISSLPSRSSTAANDVGAEETSLAGATLLSDIKSSLAETGNTFIAYILLKLDVWNYSPSSSANEVNYTISIDYYPVAYNMWNQEYERADASCSPVGHKIMVGESIPAGIDSAKAEVISKFNEIEAKTGSPTTQEEYDALLNTMFSTYFGLDESPTVKFYISASQQDEPYGNKTQIQGANVYIYRAHITKEFAGSGSHVSDAIIFREPVSEQELNYDKKVISRTGGLINDLTPSDIFENIDASIGNGPSYYFTYAICVASTTETTPRIENSVYIPYRENFIYEDGAAVANFYSLLWMNSNEFTYYDMVPYYDTSKIDSSSLIETNLSAVAIDVKSGLDEEQSSNYKLVMEFLPSNHNSYLVNMSSVVPKLWDTVNSYSMLTNKNARGLIANYNASLNFDNEYPGRFLITVKDFADSNNKLSSFKKILYMSSEILNSCTAFLYVYTKTSSTASIKTFLGTVSFA